MIPKTRMSVSVVLERFLPVAQGDDRVPATRQKPRTQVTDERLVVHYQGSHTSPLLERAYLFLQLAVAQHLEDDVAAADELAADEHLRDRRPRRHVDQR